MDLYTAVQVGALRDVYASKKSEKAYDRVRKSIKPESGYLMRQIHRWYSKTFHTPLHEVDALPEEDVLRAWWEERYEEMNEEELEAERQDLFVDPEEIERQQRVEDAQDADTYEIVQEELAAKAAEAIKKIDQLTTSLTKPFRANLAKEPELVMSPTVKTLPEIMITFDDSIDLDSDGLGLLDKPTKR